MVALAARRRLAVPPESAPTGVGSGAGRVAAGGAAAVVALSSLVDTDVGVATYLWGSTFILAAWLAVTGWPRLPAMASGGMVAAVVLTLAAMLDTVDQASDSFPTIGRLVTLDPENVVDTPQLDADP